MTYSKSPAVIERLRMKRAEREEQIREITVASLILVILLEVIACQLISLTH